METPFVRPYTKVLLAICAEPVTEAKELTDFSVTPSALTDDDGLEK